MPKATTRILQIEKALRTILQAKKWIPSVVKAMIDTHIYAKADVSSVDHIADNWHVTLITKEIEKEKKLKFLRSKWTKIIRRNRIYKFVAIEDIFDSLKLDVVKCKTVLVAKVLGFNKCSVEIQVLATDSKSDFYRKHHWDNRKVVPAQMLLKNLLLGRILLQSRIIYQGNTKYGECPFSLDVATATEVYPKDLALYVGMNPTAALMSLLKEG